MTRSYPDGTDRPLRLTDLSHLSKTVLRAEADTAAAGFAAVDFGSSRLDGEVVVLGLRPGEWMLVGAGAEVATVLDRIDLTGAAHTIDHRHARALFELRGPDAASTLEKVCSIDFSEAMTPNGAVVSGSVAKVTCDLARHDDGDIPAYLIACDRSFGQYLFDALIDAGDEFALGVAAS